MITAHWYTMGFSTYAPKCCQACVICATHNVGRGIPVTQAAHPPPDKPFDHLLIDFIELTPTAEGKKYSLVMVDMFSKWVEAYPMSKQDSTAVAKILLSDIIPRWGIPTKISSDNGAPFANKEIKLLGKYLHIDLWQHCSYHPASGGAVEHENGILKTNLAKCCADTNLKWPPALPIVLMDMRMRERTSQVLGWMSLH